MCVTVLREEYPVARKDYHCDACYQLLQGMAYPDDFTEEEVITLAQAKADGWKIKKGQQYVKQVNKYDDIYTFRARPEVLKIYFKYDIGDSY